MDCAVRTIWRDLAVMQEAGLPIYDERAPELGVRAFAPTLRPATTDYVPEIRKALLDRRAVQVRATFDQGAYRVEVLP